MVFKNFGVKILDFQNLGYSLKNHFHYSFDIQGNMKNSGAYLSKFTQI